MMVADPDPDLDPEAPRGTAGRPHIYAVDVADISDRLGLEEREVLKGLASAQDEIRREQGISTPPQADRTSDAASPSQSEAVSYSVALIVTDAGLALLPVQDGRTVLEVMITRLARPGCAHLLLSGTLDATPYVADATRILEQAHLHKHTFISCLQPVHDEAFAVCQASAHLQKLDGPESLIIVRLQHVFAVAAVVEMAVQQRYTEVYTGDLTKVLWLLDPLAAPNDRRGAGLWACSASAVQQLAALFRTTNINIKSPASTIPELFDRVFGELCCQSVIANEALNWEDVVDRGHGNQGVALVPRFQHAANYHDHEDAVMFGDNNQCELPSPVRFTSIVKSVGSAHGSKTKSIMTSQHGWRSHNGAACSPSAVESTPLLGNNGRYDNDDGSTNQDAFEDEDPSHEVASASSNRAFLIHFEHPRASDAEFVLALKRGHDVHPLWTTPPGRPHSCLPSAVKDILLEAAVKPKSSAIFEHHDEDLAITMTVQKRVPLIAYCFLLVSICSLAASESMLLLLPDVPLLLLLFWHMTGSALLLLPIAGVQIRRNHALPLLRRKKCPLVTAAVGFAVCEINLLLALDCTSLRHVCVLASTQPLLLLLSKRLRFGASSVSFLDLIGSLLGFVGGAVSMEVLLRLIFDVDSTAIPPSFAGDGVAFIGAVAGALFLLTAHDLRPVVGTSVLGFSTAATTCLLLLPLLLLRRDAMGLRVHHALDPAAGLLGWFHHPRIATFAVGLGAVGGSLGLLASLKYFEALAAATALLLQPTLALGVGAMLGIWGPPSGGMVMVLGSGAVVLGCLSALWAAHGSALHVDISDRVVKTRYTSIRTVVPVSAAAIEDETETKRRRRSEIPVVQTAAFRANYGSM